MPMIWRKIASQDSNIEVLVEKSGEEEEELCRILTYERRRITKNRSRSRVAGFRVSYNGREFNLDADGNVKAVKIKYEDESPDSYPEHLRQQGCPRNIIDKIIEYVSPKIKEHGQGRLF